MRYQRLLQRFPSAVDVGLDLGERHVEQRRDFQIALALEVKENERDTLVVGQATQRLFELLLLLRRRQDVVARTAAAFVPAAAPPRASRPSI